ncbi:MAG: dihydroorotate dehydrogenase [Candidatus Thermoplasmatota archaeon]|nr:dihydroorotate dehydrogenase [Candidatus Thermoplasmatota archaeon]
MEGPKLDVEVAGIRFLNPLILASGVADETGASMAEAVRMGAGGVVTKSLSLEPREGHPNPCVVEFPYGILNAMGLPNPGVRGYSDEVEEYLSTTRGSAPIIASVFGSSIEEYAMAAGAVKDLGVHAVEINGSCPNARGLGLQFGQDPLVIEDLVKEVKATVPIPVFFKLTPACSSIVDLAQAAQMGGADGLVAVNTMPAMKIDVRTRMPVLTNVTGGLSGPALRPVGVRCVYQIANSGKVHLPIIGAGGISTWEDALEYIMAGASAVQIGTAVTWGNLDVFSKIKEGMMTYMIEERIGRISDMVGSAKGVRS